MYTNKILGLTITFELLWVSIPCIKTKERGLKNGANVANSKRIVKSRCLLDSGLNTRSATDEPAI